MTTTPVSTLSTPACLLSENRRNIWLHSGRSVAPPGTQLRRIAGNSHPAAQLWFQLAQWHPHRMTAAGSRPSGATPGISVGGEGGGYSRALNLLLSKETEEAWINDHLRCLVRRWQHYPLYCHSSSEVASTQSLKALIHMFCREQNRFLESLVSIKTTKFSDQFLPPPSKI